MTKRPTVREMLQEAAENFDGRVKNSELRKHIQNKYGDVKTSTINAHIRMCTVNNPKRIHWERNKKPRKANQNIDILYSTDKGIVELYKPNKHGTWEIFENEHGILSVRQSDIESLATEKEETGRKDHGTKGDADETLMFPLESHLRDFIAKNLQTIHVNNKKLFLYVDKEGRNGIEYPTEEVGFIDILAIDEDKNYVVFELKVSKGSDKALGQIQRYMGWVKTHLADDRGVKGVIIGKNLSKRLKYAVKVTPEISLFEYDLLFNIRSVS